MAVYHSHPTSHAVPSRTDLERHGMEEVVCLIVSLTTNPPTVRGWWLTEANYREAEWEITEAVSRDPEGSAWGSAPLRVAAKR